MCTRFASLLIAIASIARCDSEPLPIEPSLPGMPDQVGNARTPLKMPADALVPMGGKLSFPMATKDLHHEVELAVALKGGGRQLSADAAQALIFGYAVALDMTRRDLQAEAKRLARPWDMAKGFDQSCPISALRPAASASTALRGDLLLSVNGEVRQRGDLSDMIWSPSECLAVLSTLVELRAGDLLLTGTPAGVGPVAAGDVLEAKCALTPDLQVQYLGLEAWSATPS